ncbi:hypothetical protein [uncultured Shimia sp.]|uniref:hypothetical protein n=1 Tax=uncultured Shimia sp. TaxID=573152 RepID=UPI002617F7BF|nr:hypothetical protein [uncultured Shimia sp.]
MSSHWYSNQTRVYWTCKALLDGRNISHKTEIREVKGWRLGAIIHNLRKKYDWPILAEYRGPENIAHYKLCSSAHHHVLRFPRSAKELANEVASK